MTTRQTAPAFLRWCHTQPGTCAHPGCDAPWTELHHYGRDGGTGRRPNDYEVVRLCRACHDAHGRKATALILRGRWEVLAAWQADTIALLRGWMEDGRP